MVKNTETEESIAVGINKPSILFFARVYYLYTHSSTLNIQVMAN
jgi:hypothetical protein